MSTLEMTRLVEPFGSPDTQERNAAIRQVADTLHRLNHQIALAVRAGVTVELMRTSRFHDGKGSWGDQMVPIIRVKDGE